MKESKSITNIPREPEENKEGIKIGDTATEITACKKLEIELNETKELFEMAILATKDGVWDWNLKTNEVFFSTQWKKMLGFEENEISGSLQEWDKRVHPDDKKRTYFDINKHISGDTDIYINEHRVLCKDGCYKWILDRGVIIERDEDGSPARMIGTHTDITERKNNEKSLSEKNVFKDKLFSIISHDLRSPFNALLGMNGIVLQKIDEGDYSSVKDITEMIYKTSQQTLHLLNNLLYWSRMQTGKLDITPQLLSFNKLIEDTIDLMKVNLNNKNVSIKTFVPAEFKVYADPTMLETVVRNLLSNAIKFSNIGGTIIIAAKRTDSCVEIYVSDNGIGIAPNQLNKIFDFKEIYSTRGTKYEKGTGLGLVVCKEFVEKHNGKIWIESEVNKGTKITFSICEQHK